MVTDMFRKYILAALTSFTPVFKLTETEKKKICILMQDYVNVILMSIVDLDRPKTEETLQDLIKQRVFKIIREQIRPLNRTKLLTREEFDAKSKECKKATAALIEEENNKAVIEEQNKILVAKKAAKRKRKNQAKKEQKRNPSIIEPVQEIIESVQVVAESVQNEKMPFPETATMIDWALDEDQVVTAPVQNEKMTFREMAKMIDWTLDEDQEEIYPSVAEPVQNEKMFRSVPESQVLSYANICLLYTSPSPRD